MARVKDGVGQLSLTRWSTVMSVSRSSRAATTAQPLEIEGIGYPFNRPYAVAELLWGFPQ
jgi:hypothetical protein